MTHDDLEKRIQDELDGVATAEERAELRRLLEASPEARARYDAMKAVFRVLDRVEVVEPPPALKERVILGLPPATAPRPTPWWRSAFQRKPSLGWGYSFSAGLASGLLVVVLASSSDNPMFARSTDPAKLSGSMVPLGSRDAAIVDETRLELDANTATIESRGADRDAFVRIETETPSADVLVGYDPGVFILQSFQQGGAASGQVDLEPGRIHIRKAGSSRYEFVLRQIGDSQPPLQVSIQSGDKVISRTLRSGPARKE